MFTRKRSTEMYRGYSRVYGTDEYFESGGWGHNVNLQKWWNSMIPHHSMFVFNDLRFTTAPTLSVICTKDVVYRKSVSFMKRSEIVKTVVRPSLRFTIFCEKGARVIWFMLPSMLHQADQFRNLLIKPVYFFVFC
jgi:hypothetical protein